ncbi:MAG: fibrillarin-like rRNA/tRNA 2'-O-methyltransferase [Candidatus Nanosalina sp.]
MEEIQPGIFRQGDLIYTRAASGEPVYGENFIEDSGTRFRRWEASRSKAGAAVQNSVELGLEQDDLVLYLGAASGTTVSHFSDILAEGFVFAVEYSDTVIRDLVKVAENRENIAPILANARNPEEYEDLIEPVDVVFQDISQKDQAEIFLKNADRYLKDDGLGLIAIKAQSISSSRDPEEIFEEVKDKLEEKFDFLEETRLEPYETDHLFLKMRFTG